MNKEPMYKIGIVGYGVVGKGVHTLFNSDVITIYDPHIDVNSAIGSMLKGYDYDRNRDDLSDDFFENRWKDDRVPSVFSNKNKFSEVDLAVICVPTNETKDGYADTSIVWESLEWLSKTMKEDSVILIKSTTPPQELRAMQEEYPNIVFSPEYMGESKYFTPFWKYPDPEEMKYHDFQIFGGYRNPTSKCVDIFIRVMGPHVKFHQTDIATAGLAKYMENSFFAMKVTFCNEWFDIAKAHKVDYNTLRELWLLDSRISPMHTAVFPKDRGYGGKCYPKDSRAIIYESEELGYKPELMKTMDKVNTKFRNKKWKKKNL